MKKALLYFLCLLQLKAIAQLTSTNNANRLYKDGMSYLGGVTKTYNPIMAKQLFYQAVALGDAKAMNAIGNLYAKGIGVVPNTDSVLKWYNSAGEKGYTKAYFNLGHLYKEGSIVTQDFTKATNYFKQGIADIDCKAALAYMYYKGLGVPQDYTNAFTLFSIVAKKGNPNAMYFLGLCYRNGYGTMVNIEEAKFWLQKAVQLHEAQATEELYQEPMPENLSSITPELQHKLEALKNYKEKFIAANTNNYEGNYTGYVVYYDWSGKYVSEILPLQLTLVKNISGYAGKWQEGENNTTNINLNILNGQCSFSKESNYTRVNHYSGQTPELWQFNNAQLQLGFVGDSTQLSGYVKFYSPKRAEPGKPLQIFLTKVTNKDLMQQANVSEMVLYPNPAQQQTTVQFTLTHTANTNIQIRTQLGSIVYNETSKLLPQGTYNYTLPLANLPAATYNISISVNGKIVATKILVKQ
jgi:uncharacterized protein